MLKRIKLSYFFNLIIFSHIEERQKLKLIKYNKSLQRNMDISIINYKHFSGKYIIYESNEIGKEYNGMSDLLLFEGEFLKGERNGKGKEYFFDGELEFVGEYLNGKRNGKGKEYWENNNLKFDGEYLNGKRNGKGKEYYSDYKLSFEGEYLNGLKWVGIGYDAKGNINYKLNNDINGKVKEYYYDCKLKFEGEFLNGKRNGKGKEYFLNGGLEFEGEYLNGKRNGKGKEYNWDGKLKFEGEYLNDFKWNGKAYNKLGNVIYELKDGKGLIKEYNEFNEDEDENEYNHLKFEGEYLNGERNGKGKQYFNGQLIFEGEYLNGKKNGKGKEYFLNGGLEKVNIYMVIKLKVSIIIKIDWNMKANIYITKNGMVKDMMKMVILYMN